MPTQEKKTLSHKEFYHILVKAKFFYSPLCPTSCYALVCKSASHCCSTFTVIWLLFFCFFFVCGKNSCGSALKGAKDRWFTGLKQLMSVYSWLSAAPSGLILMFRLGHSPTGMIPSDADWAVSCFCYAVCYALFLFVLFFLSFLTTPTRAQWMETRAVLVGLARCNPFSAPERRSGKDLRACRINVSQHTTLVCYREGHTSVLNRPVTEKSRSGRLSNSLCSRFYFLLVIPAVFPGEAISFSSFILILILIISSHSTCHQQIAERVSILHGVVGEFCLLLSKFTACCGLFSPPVLAVCPPTRS